MDDWENKGYLTREGTGPLALGIVINGTRVAWVMSGPSVVYRTSFWKKHRKMGVFD